MAGGNLGDLWFQLGVKDNTSKELQKIIDKLKTGDDAANSLLRALQGFGTKKSGFKEQAEKAKEFADVLNEINRRISKLKKNDKSDEAKDLQMAVKNALSYLDMLQRINIERSKISELRSLNPNVDTSKLKEAELMLENVNNQLFRLQNKAQGGGGGGVDYANVLQDYAKVLQMTFRDVRQITDQFKKENPLSAFSGGAAKVEADISRVTEKLAKMRDLMTEGTLKGYNTNMLGGSITELDKILARLQAASGNKSLLTDAAQMKNLLSDVAVEMTKATAATQAYGREKGKVIAQEREFATASKLSVKDNEAELKALSDYAKRYMALQEAKQKAEKRASDERKRKSEEEARRIEADTERMSRLYAKMSLVIGRGERAGMRGLELGVNTSALERALSEATELKKRIEDANVALMGKGGRSTYEWYSAQVNRLSSNLADVTQAQRELNSAQDKANRKAEAQAIRDAAQAERDAAKAKRDDAAAEKQRQREINITLNRVQSLSYAMEKLQSVVTEGKRLNIDTSRAEAKIKELGQEIQVLNIMNSNLKGKDWKPYLGDVGQVGNGRSVKEANHLATELASVNREAQRGVELEQKRQQEIINSAAKARNDLAAAFAGVNAEAKKMQSIVGDIKSLFLQGGIVFGAQQFFNSIVQTGGEIVQQHVALRSILGDVQKADELFAQTQQLALQSPFKFGELNRDVKQLAAFGVEANDLYDTTKRLADIASGLGVDFGRLGLAFGQVKARSWLDGKELRQFAYAGLPLLQKITELYNSEGKNGRKNYTQADVKKMISGRQVSFEDVQKVLWKMTDEGGQFYNMQLVLSETLLGRWNKLIDAWDIMLGKFAEGKNVIGGTFSFIINRVTDLVLALDKLSPAMLSFGAIFAARKLGLMASGKLGLGSLNKNYTQQLNMQLRAYAIEQQQLVTEGKITQQKALQNVQARGYLLSDTASRANAISRLALEGKMSILQLQKAFKEGLVTKELIKQLAVMGQITAKQEQIILGGTRFAAIMNMGIAKIGGGIKSLFTMLGGWVGLALGVAVQTISSYNSAMDRITENANGLRDSAYNKKKGYEDELANDKPTNSADLQQRVNTMKELLRNSGDYTQTIEDQISKAKDLNEQYDILNKGIIAARDNSQQEANDSEVIAGALGASGGWGSGNPFTDTLEESVEDLNEAVIKYQTLLSGLDEDTKARMDNIANQFLKPEERTLALDEKIRILSERGGENWDSFVLKSSNGSNDIANSIYKIGIRADKVTDKLNDISKNNVPRIIKYLQKAFNAFGVDFSKWCNNNSARFESMVEKMLDACKVNVPQIREYLKSIFYQEAGAKQPKKASGGKTEKPKTPMQQRIRKNLTKKGKNKSLIDRQASLLDSYLDETSDYNTDNNLQTELQNRYNEYKNRENKFKRGKISKALRDEAWENYNSLNQAAWEGLGYKFYPQDKKSNKIPKGKKNTHASQEDKELETLRKRIDLYKKFYSELEKYRKIYGDEGAMIQMRNDKEFKNSVLSWKLSDPGTYGSSVEELMRRLSSSTQKRREYKESQRADIHAKNRSIEEERIRATNNMLSKRLSIISEQYKTYKKIYELTGNNKGSSMLAFGYVQSGTYQDYLKEQMKWAVKEHNERTGQNLSADDVLKMSESDFNKHIGSESENASVIYKEWAEETARIKQETIDLLANLVEKNATIDQQIEDENRKYERQLELIKGIKDTGMRDRATEGAEKTHNENLAKLEFERFKQGSDWVTIFDDLDRVSSTTINSMVEKIDEFSKTTGLSVEVVKQLRDALGKLRDEQIDRNPINGIIGGMQRGNAIGSFIDSRFRKGMDISTTTYVGADDAKKMGIQKGNYTKGQLEGEQKGAYADANKGVAKLADKFKALQDCISPVINLFEVLGEEDSFLGQATSTASGAFGAAAQVSGGLNALGLGNLGPYGAAAGAALSVVTSLFAMHDKALQKEIEASEERQKEFDNMTKNIKSIIEDTLGGIYSYKVSEDTKNTLNKVTSDYERSVAWKNSKTGKNFPFLFNSIYSSKTYEAAKEAQSKPDSAYHAELASLMAQRDELQSQRNSESKKKKKDDSKIADYNQQIKEMEQQINTFAQDFLKDIYSIDMKSWASELTDAVVSAWEKGEDAVEAYREKVKDMVKDVTKNIVTQKIMESALREPLNYLTGILKDKGKLDETDMDKLADMLYKAGDEVVPQITGIFEALKNRGWDFRDNGSCSSTKNSIQSITEETADIIASYLNSIRLDVSVNREYIKIISDYLKNIPEMNAIAQSQLDAMNQLVSLAEYRNDRLDDMYSWMRSVTKDTGSKSLRIS